MEDRCKRHNRYNCYDYNCRRAAEASSGSLFNPGSGRVGLDFDGDVNIGLGGGIGIDASDGSLTIGGFDTDGN